MKRREAVLALLAVGIAPTSALAQPPGKHPRIGVLWPTPVPSRPPPQLVALLKGLQDLGWQEGKTVAIEYRYGGSDAVRLGEIAKELVRLKVDVITTFGDLATRAAQQATTTIPIVSSTGFPVESGFVASLSRPGGNITGVAVMSDEASAKRLEMLKGLVPQLKRVAVLWDPVTHERQPRAVEAAALSLGLQIQLLRAGSASELEGAFDAAKAARAEAVLVLVSPMFSTVSDKLASLAAKHRLPAMYSNPAFTEAAGLIAYGPTVEEQWGLVARSIDKILKGAKPGDLPVEQPTKFELVINLKTAKALGITIPPSVLLRADRVIE